MAELLNLRKDIDYDQWEISATIACGLVSVFLAIRTLVAFWSEVFGALISLNGAIVPILF